MTGAVLMLIHHKEVHKKNASFACFFCHIIVLQAGRGMFQMLSDLHLEECLCTC